MYAIGMVLAVVAILSYCGYGLVGAFLDDSPPPPGRESDMDGDGCPDSPPLLDTCVPQEPCTIIRYPDGSVDCL